jgi:RNA polymerase sigma-70 factor (ECF subfamily)
VVDAFLAAAQDANFKALLEVLDPDVTLRADAGDRADLTKLLRGPGP